MNRKTENWIGNHKHTYAYAHTQTRSAIQRIVFMPVTHMFLGAYPLQKRTILVIGGKMNAHISTHTHGNTLKCVCC